ncbi:helix-turn-helix domain-containing protein [Aeromonas hydrophila]|uniref:helix-turn-helix domain-containing protein n=1 Tax=Aeromonas hydrophila TaxID=644 RepID=UPI003F794574
MPGPSVKVTLEALAMTAAPRCAPSIASFLQQLGCTFRQWREQVVMGRARQLQHQGMAPAVQIADLLGYEDPAAFSGALQRLQGVAQRREPMSASSLLPPAGR